MGPEVELGTPELSEIMCVIDICNLPWLFGDEKQREENSTHLQSNLRMYLNFQSELGPRENYGCKPSHVRSKKSLRPEWDI